MEWIFDGIGTAIVSGLIGMGIGGCVGYYIRMQVTIKQKQKARDNAQQSQIGQINDGNN
jgi:hypothetical protein